MPSWPARDEAGNVYSIDDMFDDAYRCDNARGSCAPCCKSPIYMMLQIFLVYSVMLERQRYTYLRDRPQRPAV